MLCSSAQPACKFIGFLNQITSETCADAALADNIITKSLPKDPPFYSGRQHSAFFPCDEKNFKVTVTLLKTKEEGQSFSEIQTLQFGSSSSRIQT